MDTSRSLRRGRAIYLVVLLLTSLFYYEFLGAAPTPSEKPEEIAWWRPAGWVTRSESAIIAPLQEMVVDAQEARKEGETDRGGLVPVALFAALPVALTVVGFVLFESSWVRAALLGLGLSLCAFSYYGWLAPRLWSLFTWRWPAALLVTTGYAALFVLAPSVAADVRKRPRLLLAVALLFVSIVLLSTEVTGTNPELYLNTSPWPVVTLFGFLLVGLVLGVIHFAVGLGLFVRQALPGSRGFLAGAALAALIAVLLGGLPFEELGLGNGLLLAVPAALVALVVGRREGAEGVRSAGAFLAAGLFLLTSIEAGQWLAESFLSRARDEVAPQVIAGLESYREDHACYPDELSQLVPAYLPALPSPRVGFFRDESEAFGYVDLGSSYLLEFSSVLWVQCAYSPPYADLYDDEDGCEPGEAGDLESGSWSCESKPPELW